MGLHKAAIMMVWLSASAVAHDTLADEGMWLFNVPPTKQLKERYGFEPSAEWLRHLQHAAVRFNSGGSGSFVSADGLVITNHHVGADALQKLSSAGHDYLKDGFHARARSEEIKCVDLELNVLESIEDVTSKIEAVVKPGMDTAAAQQARRAVMNTLEEESRTATGLRSDVITLYQGGQYNLYRYKKYTDIRLVFAPEQDIAFFGGDPDNFEYPRYDLDICFFRVYEHDEPAKIEHYLAWSKRGAEDKELVFVAGNPGHTDRLNTVEHLEFLRDRIFPSSLNRLRRHEVLLLTYSSRGQENARRAQDDLFGAQNSRKARSGGLAGLQDPKLIDQKRAAETRLRDQVNRDPVLAFARGAWDEISAAVKVFGEIQPEYVYLEHAEGFHCELFHIARLLVRMAEESAKPNTDRLREYRQSNRESLEQMLYSTAPIYPDLETAKLADSLSALMERFGAAHPLVAKVMDGKSPRQRAVELVQGSRLADVGVRKEIAGGGQAAIDASGDTMIALAKLVDGPSRQVRKTYEQRVDEPLRQAYSKISRAKFLVSGTDQYPDATFTLRLAFGTVRGYEQDGNWVPAWTTIGGAFAHAEQHGSQPPFKLPASWLKRRTELDLETPFNFVCTADIIGGNSGSPVVNRAGEFVGIIFDGNIESLVLDFIYTDETARAVSVHSSSILEALRKVYNADALADELRPK
jgi:hypothetical protein